MVSLSLYINAAGAAVFADDALDPESVSLRRSVPVSPHHLVGGTYLYIGLTLSVWCLYYSMSDPRKQAAERTKNAGAKLYRALKITLSRTFVLTW